MFLILETISSKERNELIKNIIEDIYNLYGYLKEEIDTTVKQNIENNETITIKREYKKYPKFDLTSSRFNDVIRLYFYGSPAEYKTLKNYLFIKYELLINYDLLD